MKLMIIIRKAPRAYWVDTVAALYLTGEPEPRGAHLENLVLSELLSWRDSQTTASEVMYWRTARAREVDFVVESGRRVLGIEVKSTSKPTRSDAVVLRDFVASQGDAGRRSSRTPAAHRRRTHMDG